MYRLALLSVLVLRGGVLRAQSTDELRRLALQEWTSVAQAESIAVRQRKLDSASYLPTQLMVINGVLILHGARHRTLVERAAREAFDPLPPHLRAALTPALRNLALVIHRDGDRITYVPEERPRAAIEFISVDSNTTVGLLTRSLSEKVSTYLAQRLDSIGVRWIGQWLPVRALTREDGQLVYRSLATSLSPSARECINGSRDGCVRTLRITLPKDTVREWYGAADRRDLIRRHLESPQIAEVDSRRLLACLQGDDDECEHVLRQMGPSTWRAPVHDSALESFMDLVIREGGAGSLERFLSSSLPLPSRIEYAAGRPIAVLIPQWQREVMAARPESGWPTPGNRWFAFGSMCVLCGSALWLRRWV